MGLGDLKVNSVILVDGGVELSRWSRSDLFVRSWCPPARQTSIRMLRSATQAAEARLAGAHR
eukprot:3592753-Amphidinium_carterae.1